MNPETYPPNGNSRLDDEPLLEDLLLRLEELCAAEPDSTPGDLIDPWGHAFVYNRSGASYVIKSAGPDGYADTGDDLNLILEMR